MLEQRRPGPLKGPFLSVSVATVARVYVASVVRVYEGGCQNPLAGEPKTVTLSNELPARDGVCRNHMVLTQQDRSLYLAR